MDTCIETLYFTTNLPTVEGRLTIDLSDSGPLVLFEDELVELKTDTANSTLIKPIPQKNGQIEVKSFSLAQDLPWKSFDVALCECEGADGFPTQLFTEPKRNRFIVPIIGSMKIEIVDHEGAVTKFEYLHRTNEPNLHFDELIPVIPAYNGCILKISPINPTEKIIIAEFCSVPYGYEDDTTTHGSKDVREI